MIFSPAPLRSGHAFEFENLHLPAAPERRRRCECGATSMNASPPGHCVEHDGFPGLGARSHVALCARVGFLHSMNDPYTVSYNGSVR
jgi:hypothetical protein